MTDGPKTWSASGFVVRARRIDVASSSIPLNADRRAEFRLFPGATATSDVGMTAGLESRHSITRDEQLSEALHLGVEGRQLDSQLALTSLHQLAIAWLVGSRRT